MKKLLLLLLFVPLIFSCTNNRELNEQTNNENNIKITSKEKLRKILIEKYADSEEIIDYHLSRIEEDVLDKIYDATKDNPAVGDEIELRQLLFDVLESSKPYLLDGYQNNPNDIKWNNYCHCVCDFVLNSGVNSIQSWYAHPNAMLLGQDAGVECGQLLE